MGLHKGSIAIDPETIGNLLKGGHLRVPASQRSYRWKEEHVEDLYRDMRGAIDNGEDEYFVGSIVGIKSGGKTFIYDGQQRLATTMILIAAIRDRFLKDDAKTADLVEQEFLVSEDRKTHDKSIHFILNTEDSPFFQNRVLSRPQEPARKAIRSQSLTRDSHKRISAAASTARKFVGSITENLSAANAQKALHRWLDFIQE